MDEVVSDRKGKAHCTHGLGLVPRMQSMMRRARGSWKQSHSLRRSATGGARHSASTNLDEVALSTPECKPFQPYQLRMLSAQKLIQLWKDGENDELLIKAIDPYLVADAGRLKYERERETAFLTISSALGDAISTKKPSALTSGALQKSRTFLDTALSVLGSAANTADNETSFRLHCSMGCIETRLLLCHHGNADTAARAIEHLRTSRKLAPILPSWKWNVERMLLLAKALSVPISGRKVTKAMLDEAIEALESSPGVTSIDDECLDPTSLRLLAKLIELKVALFHASIDHARPIWCLETALRLSSLQDPERHNMRVCWGSILMTRAGIHSPRRDLLFAGLKEAERAFEASVPENSDHSACCTVLSVIHSVLYMHTQNSGHIENAEHFASEALKHNSEYTEYKDLAASLASYWKTVRSGGRVSYKTMIDLQKLCKTSYSSWLNSSPGDGQSIAVGQPGVQNQRDSISSSPPIVEDILFGSSPIAGSESVTLALELGRILRSLNHPGITDEQKVQMRQLLDKALFRCLAFDIEITSHFWQLFAMAFGHWGDKDALISIVAALQQGLKYPGLTPKTWADGNYKLVVAHIRLGDLYSAREVCIQGIKHGATLVDYALPLEDQQFVVKTCSGLASFACAATLSEDPSCVHTALEHLENGRALILGNMLVLQADITDLTRFQPDLAAELQQLRHRLGALHQNTASLQPPNVPNISTNDQFQAASSLRSLLERIRLVEGYDRLLLTPSEGELLTIAKTWGNIVLVNGNELHCNAILITGQAISQIPLPQFNVTDLKVKFADSLFNCEVSSRPKMNKQAVEDSLPWLYNSAVLPVLRGLGCHRPGQWKSAKALPRIWWIGCGLASHLPFHAAGVYREGQLDTTMDNVISSYAPTLQALVHVRKHSACLSTLKDGFNVVGTAMEFTPGMSPLAQVKRELDIVSSIIEKNVPDATITQTLYASEVLDLLRKTPVIHLACHGLSDLKAPSQSYLALLRKADAASNGSRGEVERLTLAQLTETNLDRACIAFLSACSTSQNGLTPLMDEVLHLASGFLVAGFRHVIASMWPVLDKVSVEFAKVFWEWMFETPVTDWQDRTVAEAVHVATLHVRDDMKKSRQPLAWAPYVHWGA